MEHLKKQRESDKNKHYDWVTWPQSYFVAALLLADTLPKTEYEIENENVFEKFGFKSAHSHDHLIWPIIFNFKQGIELWLKALGNIDHGKYLQGHDLKAIFGFIIETASPQNKGLIEKLERETWPTIDKYYSGQYVPYTKKGGPDTSNEVERFPERLRNKDTYQPPESYEWANKAISGIIKDIKFLEEKFEKAERDIVPGEKFNYGE